jgi:hypothetical protein
MPQRTAMAPRSLGLALACAAVLNATPAAALTRFAVQQDIVRDARGGQAADAEYLDTTFLAAWKRAHAALTLGSFDAGAEVGAYACDARGSAYGATLRRRIGGTVENSSLEFETLQKLGRTVVGAALRGFWPDHPEGRNLLFVPSAGVDFYYAGESFVSFRASLDPRPGTGAIFRIANRLGDARRQVDLTLTPRTDGACGWSVRGRYQVFVAGFGAEPDFDFTSIDRQIWYLGFEYDLRP